MKQKLFKLQNERRTKPFLLLEIGQQSLRLHKIENSQDPIEIILLHEEELPHGAQSILAEKVSSLLEVESDVRDIAIVMNSPAIRQHMIGIPPMGAAEQEKVLALEMKRLSDGNDESCAFSSWSAGRIKEQGATKEFVLCADIPQTIVNSLIAVVQAKKLNLIGFTSHTQMVSLLLAQCELEGTQNPALLEINEHTGSIALFHANIWNMDRHFLIGSPSIPEETTSFGGLNFEKLKLEVGRALQYFKQQVRTENINQIFLYGDTRHSEEIKKFLESFFRIPVFQILLDEKVFFTGASAAEGGSPDLFQIAHAVALHSRFDRYIDFLPQDWRQQKQIKMRQYTIAGAAAIMYLFLAIVAFLFHVEAAKIPDATLRPQQSRISAFGEKDRAQEDRSFALAVDKSHDLLYRKHSLLGKMMRELAGAIPSEMRITSLAINEKDADWHIQLQAEIKTPNGSRSRQLLLDFQDDMRNKSCLRQMDWGEVLVADSSKSSLSATTEQQNTLTFKMEGRLGPPNKPGTQK